LRVNGYPKLAVLGAILGVIAICFGTSHRILARWHKRNLAMINALLDRIHDLTPQTNHAPVSQPVEAELPKRLSNQA